MANVPQFTIDDWHSSDFDLLAEILSKPDEVFPSTHSLYEDSIGVGSSTEENILLSELLQSPQEAESSIVESYEEPVLHCALPQSPPATHPLPPSSSTSSFMRSAASGLHQTAGVSNPHCSCNSNVGLQLQQQSHPSTSLSTITQPSNLYQSSAFKFRPTKLFTQQITAADGTTRQSIVIVDIPDGENNISANAISNQQSLMEHSLEFYKQNSGDSAAKPAGDLKDLMDVDESQAPLDTDCETYTKTKELNVVPSPVNEPPDKQDECMTVAGERYCLNLPPRSPDHTPIVPHETTDEITLNKVPDYLVIGRAVKARIRLPPPVASSHYPASGLMEQDEPLTLNKIPPYCLEGIYNQTKKSPQEPQQKQAPSVNPHVEKISPLGSSTSKSSNLSRKRKAAMDKAVTERRIVFIGGLPFNCTPRDLRSMFECYGSIETVSVHFREKGDNYGFVTFFTSKDALKAMQDDKYSSRYTLCFGGRRRFCKTDYADLDGCTAVREEWAMKEVSFSEKSF